MVEFNFKNSTELVNLINDVSKSLDKSAEVFENEALMKKIFKFIKGMDNREKEYLYILDFVSNYWEYREKKEG